MTDSPSLPVIEPLPPTLSAVEGFQRLAHLPHVVFFDSAATDARLGRYSFVAADPFAWIERSADGTDALADVEALLSKFQYHVTTRPDLPPFQGGLAGLLSYDLNRSFERVPVPRYNDLPTPALAMGAYDVVLAFDHLAGQSWIISQGLPEFDSRARQDRAAARLVQFRQHLTPSPPAARGAAPQHPVPSPEPPLPRPPISHAAPRHH